MAKRLSIFTFTKLVVDDLEKMAAFYGQVFKLEQIVALGIGRERHLIELVERFE
jgi:predicted enzyme related to lactoylglutathione lyase